jgi:hypothetical protein
MRSSEGWISTSREGHALAGKTIADLKILRGELGAQMTQTAYDLTRSINQRALERLALLSEAIYALDDVIEAGKDEAVST